MSESNTKNYSKSIHDTGRDAAPQGDQVSFFEKALLSAEEETAYRESSAEGSVSKAKSKRGFSLNHSINFFIAAAIIMAGGLFFADIMFMGDYVRLPAEAAESFSVSVYVMVITYLVVAGLAISAAIFLNWAIRRPLNRMLNHMDMHTPIPPSGAEELREISDIYNSMLKSGKFTREKLGHAASHDPLTGLYNRGAYELLIRSADMDHIGLILIDIDRFKDVNDTYGHEVGDMILKKVADTIRHSFRSVDFVCRIGGDEFVVIMSRARQSMQDHVLSKIQNANNVLMHPSDGLPPVSLSVGAAFSDRKNPGGTIFQDADAALYKVKNAGRCGCHIY